MAAFFAGKLAREKNGRLERHGWEKRTGNLWQRRKTQLSESVEIVKSAKTSVLSFSDMAEYSQSRGNFNRCDSPFLLKEHGDLHFFISQKYCTYYPPKFRRKKCCKEKKIQPKACAKPLLQHANYDHEKSNSTNALRPRCFKLCDLSPKFI